jgi:hypothetical protein
VWQGNITFGNFVGTELKSRLFAAGRNLLAQLWPGFRWIPALPYQRKPALTWNGTCASGNLSFGIASDVTEI